MKLFDLGAQSSEFCRLTDLGYAVRFYFSQEVSADTEKLSKSLHSRTLEGAAFSPAERQVSGWPRLLDANDQSQQELEGQRPTHETDLSTIKFESSQRQVSSKFLKSIYG